MREIRHKIMYRKRNRNCRLAVLAVLLLLMAAMMMLGSCGGPSDTQISQDEEAAADAEADADTDADTDTDTDTDTDADYSIDYLILVDKDHPLPADWEENLQTESFINSVGDKVVVEKRAYAAYLQLKEALEKEDVYVDLDSAYRSVAEQQKIMDDFTEKYGADYAREYVSVPGTSEHHTGLALDLFLIVDGKIIYENEDLVQYPEIWAKIHAKLSDYGFILRYPKDKVEETGYPYEEWHIRYVGSPETAKDIEASGLSFAKYVETRKNG